MADVKRILVALDLAPLGEVKIAVAEQQARAFGAELILLHVLPEKAAGGGDVSTAAAQARAYLDAVCSRLRAQGLTVNTLLRYGPPAATVVDAAREQQADLLILGSSVREGLARLRPGSIADQIVRRTPCPVLLVRPERERGGVVPAIRSFADDAARAGALEQRALGPRRVDVARIVGSVSRPGDLGADFRTTQKWTEDQQRFQNVLYAYGRGDALPPVELYKLGYGYYVLDGHHRVAAARQLGKTSIDAVVTEFVPLEDPQTERVSGERLDFEEATGLTRVGVARPGHYSRLLALIDAYGAEHGISERREAARGWYEAVFKPLQPRLRALHLDRHFPGDRTADIFLRLFDYRREESARQGRELSWDEALAGFAEAARAPGAAPA